MAYLGTKPANQVIDSTLIADGTITPADLSTGKPVWDTSGNVGIGTSSPTQALDVNGNILGAASITIGTSGLYQAGSIYSDSNWGMIFRAKQASPVQADFMWANSAATERMRIDSSGNLLFRRTTAYAAGQGATPTLQVDTSGNGGIVLTNGSNGILIYRDNVNSITYFYNGSNQASLNSAGSWINASDGRQKSNITDIKYGLSSVLNLQPRSYKRTDVDGDFIGFVAQELKNVIPEVVMGSEETSYGVDYGSLVAVAFKAIQEQQAIITAQADTISAMEARLTALEAK